MSNATLEIRGLEKSFSAFKLGPLDLTVPEGAIYGLIGPNGAGKTTTIDLVMGMGCKDAGEVRVFGMDHLEKEVEVKKRVGYVSPDLVFNAWGRVGRLLRFVSEFYEDWDKDYCAALLRRLGLNENETISTLSFGSRTKLGLVAALSHRPDFLLLDEPLAGLDAISKQQVFTELLEAVQDEKRTVLISSHDLHDLERFTDHVGMIKNGKLLLEGPTSELVERFRMVDCATSDGGKLQTMPGLRVQKHDNDRWRVLADTQSTGYAQLRQNGCQILAEAPVTLEELFVALFKEE